MDHPSELRIPARDLRTALALAETYATEHRVTLEYRETIGAIPSAVFVFTLHPADSPQPDRSVRRQYPK